MAYRRMHGFNSGHNRVNKAVTVSGRFNNTIFFPESTIIKTVCHAIAYITCIHANFVNCRSMFTCYKARICRGLWKFRKCMARFVAYSARPLALKCVQSFLKWAMETGHTSIVHTFWKQSAKLSMALLISWSVCIVLAVPLRGGTLLRITVVWGQRLLMSVIKYSYRAPMLSADRLVASLPPTWSMMRLGFTPGVNMLGIRLWMVGISAPRYI